MCQQGTAEGWRRRDATQDAAAGMGRNAAALLQSETIAAVATPAGEGGVAIVRVSGPQAQAVAARAFQARPLRPRVMTFGQVRDGQDVVDECLAVYFAAPHSYTGEDVVEVHCHGGMAVTEAVLAALLHAGARMAQPGEFTRRAFEHGRIDLSQAEAVMDLVEARTRAGAQVALQQVQGRLGRGIRAARDRLLDLLAALEATVDYPEDDLEEAASLDVAAGLDEEIGRLGRLLADARCGRLYREGIRVALAGRPNVGKSSLLNALLGEERAIVTAIPGTTRDTVEAEAEVHGLRLQLVDTAGLRETQDPVEALGVARARSAVEQAQLVLLVLDASCPLTQEDRDIAASVSGLPCLVVCNKTDAGSLGADEVAAALPGLPQVWVSAKTGEGLDRLAAAMVQAVGGGGVQPGEALMSRQRHVEAVARAKAALEQAAAGLAEGWPPDLMAPDLRTAWRALGEITGDTADEAVIDRIFEKFCLGK